MANKNWFRDLASPDNGIVLVDGTFTITGTTGATTADSLTFASASNLSTGIYRIHLEDSYVSLKSAQFTLEMTGTQVLIPQLSGSSVGAGKYVDLMLLSASTGAPTKPTVANAVVHVSLALKNSRV